MLCLAGVTRGELTQPSTIASRNILRGRTDEARRHVRVTVGSRSIADIFWHRYFADSLIRGMLKTSCSGNYPARSGCCESHRSSFVSAMFMSASSSSGIEPDLSGGSLSTLGGASATVLSHARATPYSTWQDDFSYDKYSDRAAVHSRYSAADANNKRRRRDGVVNMRERGQ